MTRTTIIAANWKMNGDLTLVDQMSTALNNIEVAENVKVVVCPSFPFLAALTDKITHDQVYTGAQNMSEHEKGAYTGEVASQMLTNLSVQYVILGHSERRSYYGETSDLVADKVKVALNAGLTPILCIGESEQERTSGQTEQVLVSQLQPVIDAIGINAFKDVVVAYEPVWAIGTGKTASPEMAQETHAFIRDYFAQHNESVAQQLPLLYGGSMNGANCENLLAQADIDGGLIGGASLKVDEFPVICSTAKGI